MTQLRNQEPVFIVGASRSGTTLLSACLGSCTEAQIAPETHYFEDLRLRMPQSFTGSPEKIAADQRKVENYFLALTHRSYGSKGDPERGYLAREPLHARAALLGGSLDHYFEAFCLLNAERRGKTRWGEKTPRHVLRVDEILRAYPKAKIVCMIRDGRAVVASYRDFKKDPIEEDQSDPGRKEALEAEQLRVRRSYHPIIASLIWRGVAVASRKALNKHGAERVYILRYEDLVADPKRELRALSTWLGLSFDEERLATVPHMASSYSSKVQQDAGVSATAVSRWRKNLSDAELHTVESCAGRQLDDFGYDRLTPKVSWAQRCRPWLTLPWAVVRATLSNRGRHGGFVGFLFKRVQALGKG